MSLTSGPRPSARLAAFAIAMPAAAAALALGPSAALADTTVQAERLTLAPAGAGAVVRGADAQRGKALRIWGEGAAARSVSTAGRTVLLRVRARGERCDGAPRVLVEVDGIRRLAARVTSRRFATYRAIVRLRPGAHTVAVRYPNDHSSRRCDRNLIVDAVTFRTVAAGDPARAVAPRPAAADPAVSAATKPGAPAPAGAGRRIFSSDFAAKGLSAYSAVIHRERITVVDDPVLGRTRKVAKMTVLDSDTGPTENPRAQLETSRFWDEGEEYYVGFSAMFGTDWSWRACRTCWVTFHQVYGPPYAGQGPTNLNVKSNNPAGEPRVAWERTASFGYDHPFEAAITPMKWYDFVWHEKLSSNPSQGFVELWMNRGHGWERVLLHGRERLYMATKIASNGSRSDGNSSNLQLYRQRGIAPVATMYFADHSVGTSFGSVAPRSYG